MAPRVLGVFEVFEDDHAGPFAEDEPVAVQVERPLAALRGSSLAVDRAVRRLKPVTPNGWIIEWAPPPIITSASPRRRISVASPIAWVLAAQAVRQLKFGPRRQQAWPMGDRHVRLLLELEEGVEGRHAVLDEPRPVVRVVGVFRRRSTDELDEVEEVLPAFAGAEVDAEFIRVDGAQ